MTNFTEALEALRLNILENSEFDNLEFPEWVEPEDKPKRNYCGSRKPREAKPDNIIHVNDDDINKAAVISALGSFLSLGKDEAALLSYYSTCSSGFAPSLKVIVAATGITERCICRAKNNLIEKNIITWQGCDELSWDKKSQDNKYTDRICIDWSSLAAVAYLAETHPEANDNHRIYNAEGKRVRQKKKTNLGTEPTKLLWDNKPSSYWANVALISYKKNHPETRKCYSCDDDCDTCENYKPTNLVVDKKSQDNKYSGDARSRYYSDYTETGIRNMLNPLSIYYY